MAPFGEPLDIEIRRSSARRGLALRVTEPGAVVVNAPLRMSLALIEAFVHKHGEWLRERRQRAAEPGQDWCDGAQLAWLGGHLTLRCMPVSRRARVALEAEALVCAVPPLAVEAAVIGWYRNTARTYLGERLADHCQRLSLTLPPLRLSNARTRWGSLSPANGMSLNWRLLKASAAEIDYVICHELAHLRWRGHGPRFWAEVERFYPGHAEHRRTLRERQALYFRF